MIPAVDLTKIERSILIRASRARVWQAITSVAEFSKWFGVTIEGEFVAGAPVKMTSLEPCGPDPIVNVTVESIEPEQLFSWRWHPGVDRPPEGSDAPTTLVEFRLTDEDGATRVTVTETGFERIALEQRAKAFGENTKGWKHQMENLERHVQHGA
jgi:uncharacterized protein YndB with AHSA1/START domain